MALKKPIFLIPGLLLGAGLLVWAHPHLSKQISTQLPGGVKLTLQYQTVPCNEEHLEKAVPGNFLTPRGPLLTLSAPLPRPEGPLEAGAYTVGAVKNRDGSWDLALYPGTPERMRRAPTLAQIIRLDSVTRHTELPARHMSVDLVPGEGRLEGRLALQIHFGTLLVQGALN